MKSLNLSASLKIPATYAGKSAFVAGTKGSGKTYTAGVIAEGLLVLGVQTVVLDPTGVWWGLRHGANKGVEGLPVPIMGGTHGDLPLSPDAGSAVAAWIVRTGHSVVLDLGGFHSDGEQDRFVEAFCSALYRLKADNRSNLHVVMDEADLFLPETSVRMRGQERLVHAAKTLVTKGRSRGLGMTMVTQRPQTIVKSAIEEADVVFVHRIQGIRALKALAAWTDLYATKEQAADFYKALPTLADGECFVWSPQFLKIFERTKVRAKRTFDSSRTPEAGEKTRHVPDAKAIDFADVQAELAASVEAIKADDPKELRKELAAVRKKLAEAEAMLATRPEPAVERVEVPILTPENVANLHDLARELTAAVQTLNRFGGPTPTYLNNGRKAIKPVETAPPVKYAGLRMGPKGLTFGPPERGEPGGSLPKGERAILTACVQHVGGCTRPQLMQLIDLKATSIDTYVSRLVDKGYVTAERGANVVPTEAGIDALGDYERLPTGRALLDYYLDGTRLPEGERKILGLAAEVYPNRIARTDVGERIGLRSTSVDTYVSRLAARKLLDVSVRGSIRLEDILTD